MEQNSNQRVKTSVVSIMLIEGIGEAVSEASASSHTAGATFPFKRFGTAAAAYYFVDYDHYVERKRSCEAATTQAHTASEQRSC